MRRANMKYGTARIAVAAAGILLAAAPASADDPIAPDAGIGAVGASTNELIFKKRPRRQYNSKVTMDGSDAAPAAPVEPKAGPAREADATPESAPARSSLIGRSTAPSMMQNPAGSARKGQRAAKDRKKDEEDWLLTPQQRVQKEIDLLSGKDEDEEEEKSFGWLADEVESLREEKTKQMEERNRQEAGEEEAAEIAAIMGRDLFGNTREKTSLRGLMREDRGGPRPVFGSGVREPAGSATTNSLSAPELRIRDTDPEEGRMSERADGNARQVFAQPRSADGSAAGPAKSGNELQKLNERYTGTSTEARKEKDAAARDATARKAEGKPEEAAGSPGGIPSPFAWNPSTGSGYAGLPTSLAPSIMPPAGVSGAGGTSYRPPPGPGESPGFSRSDAGRAWAPGPPSGGVGLSPRVDMRPPMGQPARSPFINPSASGLQGGGGYGTLPGPRP